MKRFVAASLLCLGSAAALADDASLQVVDACRAKLDARSDIGMERIQKRCPELLPAISTAPWRDLVPATLLERREELSAASLSALAALVRNAGRSAPLGPAPETKTLAPVLKALGEQGQAGSTRWERFKRWLQKVRDSGDEDDEGFLARWSRELTTSEGVARAISYLAYAMLGALVLFVIVSELRAAGLFRARRAGARQSPEAAWRRRLLLEDVAAAPLVERPGMLLRLLGEALARARRLPAPDGLTAGAIARRAVLDSDADRDELAHVANTSDDIRYADRVPAAAALEESVDRARALLAKVTTTGGEALMRERLVTFALAIAALVAFYVLWLGPSPSLESDDTARPTTAERRGNGYAGLFEWLAKSGVPVRSFRERYTALPDIDLPATGNLLVLSLPGVEIFRNEEFAALDKWVRRGNTLLINAALIDQPGWASGRESGTVTEIESLTSLEFETRAAREARLDDTPLAQKVREADARDAKKDGDESDSGDEARPEEDLTFLKLHVRDKIPLTATGPHALLAGVRTLDLATDDKPESWSLRMPYDDFVLTLARGADGEGALFEQRLGTGRILLVAGGSLFTNRALGDGDNARFFSNVVAASVRPGGAVLFDDLRQGLSASYDPARFYKDPRLLRTICIALGAWFIWVLGSTRLRALDAVRHDPSEAELVRRAGDLVARTVATDRTALRLFDQFFAALPAAAHDDRWGWLERHAAVLPQERDQLKTAYGAARAGKPVPLVPLKRLLDILEKRLNT